MTPSEILEPFFLSDDPESVLAAARQLPRLSCGQVRKPERWNPRTGKPEREGLQCAAIFGPTEDHRCLCGFLAGLAAAGQICRKCGVLCGQSSIRQERWAHIVAPVPLLHPVLARRVAEHLGCRADDLVRVARNTANLNADGSITRAKRVEGGVYDLGEDAERDARGTRHLKARLDELQAGELLLTAVPVTPAAWRAGRRDAQDDAYLRLINRCNRLARLYELNAPRVILENEERLTHERLERAYAVVRAELLARRRRPTVVDPRGAMLLEAVIESPGDDGARAVYGDWLTEHDDPRGTFITLQIANAGKSRMSRQESELLARHYDEWLAPLADAVEWVVFRRGFLSSCRAVRKKAEPYVGHPTWATVEHLDSDLVELIAHPVMRGLRDLGTNWRCLVALCGRPEALARIEAATIRLERCPPRGWEAVVESPALPRLVELTLLHQTEEGTEDWRWLLGTPLARQLSDLTLGMALERLDGTFSLGSWLPVLDSHPRLAHLGLTFAKKRLGFHLRRAREGVEIELVTSPALVQLVSLMDNGARITEAIASAFAGIEARVVRLSAERNRWYGEHFAELRRRLGAQFGDRAALPELWKPSD